jgi:hypothetical protein
MEARMKRPEASRARRACSLALKYGVVRIHIISGMAAIRESVMELGRFTGMGSSLSSSPDYPLISAIAQTNVWLTSCR